MRWVWFFALVLAGNAAALSPADNVLYGHSDGDDAAQWMNTVAEEGGGTSTGPCSADLGPPCHNTGFEVRFPLTPDLAAPVGLDLDGEISAVIYLGGGYASAGEFTVSWQLVQGTVVIADGAAKDHLYTPKAPGGNLPDPTMDHYDSSTWTTKPLVDAILPGEPLEWVITTDGDGTNPYVATSSGRGQTRISLPVIDYEAPVEVVVEEVLETWHELPEGDAVEFAVTHDEVNTQIAHYNWTTTGVNQTLAVHAEGNGTVRLLFDDGAQTRAFDVPIGEFTDFLGDLQPGAWTIQLTATDFVGRVEVSISPLPIDQEPPEPSGQGLEDQPTVQAPEDESEPEEEDAPPVEESPGVGLLAVFALLGVALRRR